MFIRVEQACLSAGKGLVSVTMLVSRLKAPAGKLQVDCEFPSSTAMSPLNPKHISQNVTSGARELSECWHVRSLLFIVAKKQFPGDSADQGAAAILTLTSEHNRELQWVRLRYLCKHVICCIHTLTRHSRPPGTLPCPFCHFPFL